MKKILLMLFAVLAITTLSSGQSTALSIQGGYSWSYGMIGIENQYGPVSIAVGYMPASIPLTNDYVSSFSAALTWYGREYDENGLYISAAFASAAYRYNDTWNNTPIIEPMGFGMVGYKWYRPSGVMFKAGLGVGYCQWATVPNVEVTVSYKLN